MKTCFNCGVTGVELRRELDAPRNEIGSGCLLCLTCWDDMVGHRTAWADGIEPDGINDGEYACERCGRDVNTQEQER